MRVLGTLVPTNVYRFSARVFLDRSQKQAYTNSFTILGQGLGGVGSGGVGWDGVGNAVSGNKYYYKRLAVINMNKTNRGKRLAVRNI